MVLENGESSQRVKDGSKTKGSTAINLGDEEGVLLTVDDFRQGSNIRTVADGFDALSHKMRSNSGAYRTIDGRDIPGHQFNDAFSSTTGEYPSDIEGRISQRLHHQREDRDLGQSEVYDDGSMFFEAENPDNAISIMGMLDRSEYLPASLVDINSQSSLDGKIDPLDTIRNADLSGIDFPFKAKGVKGMFGDGQDAYLKSYRIEDRFMIPSKDTIMTQYYLDAPEKFGPVSLPAIFNPNVTTITPFEDIDAQEKYVRDNIADEDIRKVLAGNDFVTEDDKGKFDKLTTGGFDYYGGADSLVYGDMKK